MKNLLRFTLPLAIIVFGVSATSVLAAEPKLIREHGKWQALEFIDNGSKVCYMVSEPTKESGDYSQRGDIFALITHHPAEGTKDVFSYITGNTYKPGEEVEVTIDGQKFVLFSQDDTAWTPDAETDARLAKAIQTGSKMVVKGRSSRGTLTTDTFSLSGSGAAYKEITRACGS